MCGKRCPLFGVRRRPEKTIAKSSFFSRFGTDIATFSAMETLRAFGQVPLMFIGGFLVVLAVALVWAYVHTRSRRVRNL
jgi:hypothetical protein